MISSQYNMFLSLVFATIMFLIIAVATGIVWKDTNKTNKGLEATWMLFTALAVVSFVSCIFYYVISM